MRRAIGAASLALAMGASCGGVRGPTVVPPSLPTAAPSASEAPRTAELELWTYWAPVNGAAVSAGPTPRFPADAEKILRSPGVEGRWAAATADLRAAVLARGFAVTPRAAPSVRLGDFYEDLRAAHATSVITLDTLFFLTHLAMARAAADTDAVLVAPALGTLLRRLDTRLTAESRGARPDMASSYFVARGVVDVALALSRDDYGPPPALAQFVQGEKARVVAHTGVGVSPWLGVLVDYSAMAPRGAADGDPAQLGWFRAASWLEQAALALEGRGEGRVHAPVNVATARVHTRAALLLSRLLQSEVDAEAADAWARVDRVARLLIGDADDVTPSGLSSAVRGEKLDIHEGQWFSDVVPIDRVRHAAVRAHAATVDDGALGATVPVAGLPPGTPVGLLAPSFRLVPARVTADARLLQSLVFPLVGSLHRAAPPFTARDGVRAMPTSLDVAAWLGSGEARAAIHASGDDAYSGYDEALNRAMKEQPTEGSRERHRTPYASALDAIATWVASSAGDTTQPGASTSEWRARKADVALAAWTALRHDAISMVHRPLAAFRSAPPVPDQASEPIFVEPHPEAIAKLVALVRQTSRALAGEHVLPLDAPAFGVLGEVDALLSTALLVAAHEVEDRPLPAPLNGALLSLPGRMRALESALSPTGEADVPLAIDVHADPSSARALEETTGPIEEAWMVMREPGTHRLWLAIGASVPHREALVPMGERPTDAEWRARVAQGALGPPSALARAYRIP